MNKTMKPILTSVGTAFLLSAASSAISAAENPFAAKALDAGYEQLAGNSKMDEGKSGEGKCGGDKTMLLKKKKMEEGKCGEGKCGGDSMKMEESKCGGDSQHKMKDSMMDKATEGKCGEGKCGGDKEMIKKKIQG